MHRRTAHWSAPVPARRTTLARRAGLALYAEDRILTGILAAPQRIRVRLLDYALRMHAGPGLMEGSMAYIPGLPTCSFDKGLYSLANRKRCWN